MSEELIRATTLRVRHELLLVDYAGGNTLANLTDRLDVDNSSIGRTSNSLIHGNAVFALKNADNIDAGRHKLRYRILFEDSMGVIPGRSWRMGDWSMAPFALPLGKQNLVHIECYDILAQLSTHLRESFTAVTGENIQDALVKLLAGNELVDITVNLPTIPYALEGTETWDLLEEPTFLGIANELLLASDHDPLYMERDGTITTYMWEAIESVPPVWNFDTTLPTGGHITGTTQIEPQMEPVPNQWKGYCSSPNQLNICEPVTVTNNNPLNPFSVPSQGGRIIRRIIKVPVATTANLDTLVRRIAEEDYLKSRQIRINCRMLPNLWHNDVVNVNIPELFIFNQKGVVRKWTMPLNPAAGKATYVVDIENKGLEQ